MFFGNDRNKMREYFYDAWLKRAQGKSLEPIELLVTAVIEEHPEYHALLSNKEAMLNSEYTTESGQSNPFLHMSMHLAIREQVSTDRPNGILQAYQALIKSHGAHEAEHRIMECLGAALWEAQQNNTPPDEARYLECILRLT